MDTKNNNAPPPPVAPPATEGLDLLLCVASQAETKPKLKDSASDANGTKATAKAPFNISNVGHETAAAGDDDEDESSGEAHREAAKVEAGEVPSSHSEMDPDNLAVAAIKKQDKSFPQVLHEILAAPECQSIVHWLPDGYSFIIADKQRFSSEVLPKYFREVLLNSFIRKPNRWGFRRVKSCKKGGESSFAHSNCVRDKPSLCLNMECRSKPTFHKVSSVKNTKKKKKKSERQPTVDAVNMSSLANAVRTSLMAPPTSLLPTAVSMNSSMNSLGNMRPVQPQALAGLASSAFVPTYPNMAMSEQTPLQLPNLDPTLLMAPAAASLATTSSIRGSQYLASNTVYPQERNALEILIAQQMHQRHQLQLQLQCLNEMSPISRSRNIQSAMAQYARDNKLNSNLDYRQLQKREEKMNEDMVAELIK